MGSKTYRRITFIQWNNVEKCNGLELTRFIHPVDKNRSATVVESAPSASLTHSEKFQMNRNSNSILSENIWQCWLICIIWVPNLPTYICLALGPIDPKSPNQMAKVAWLGVTIVVDSRPCQLGMLSCAKCHTWAAVSGYSAVSAVKAGERWWPAHRLLKN